MNLDGVIRSFQNAKGPDGLSRALETALVPFFRRVGNDLCHWETLAGTLLLLASLELAPKSFGIGAIGALAVKQYSAGGNNSIDSQARRTVSNMLQEYGHGSWPLILGAAASAGLLTAHYAGFNHPAFGSFAQLIAIPTGVVAVYRTGDRKLIG